MNLNKLLKRVLAILSNVHLMISSLLSLQHGNIANNYVLQEKFWMTKYVLSIALSKNNLSTTGQKSRLISLLSRNGCYF